MRKFNANIEHVDDALFLARICKQVCRSWLAELAYKQRALTILFWICFDILFAICLAEIVYSIEQVAPSFNPRHSYNSPTNGIEIQRNICVMLQITARWYMFILGLVNNSN